MWNFPTTPSVVEVWSLNHWATGEAVRNIFFRFYCFKKIFLFFLAVLGLCCSMGFALVLASGGCSLVAARGLLLWLSVGSRACRLPQVRVPGSRSAVVAPSPASLQHVGSSRTRNQTHVSLIGRWIFFFFFFLTTEPQGKPCFGFYI